MKKQIMRKTIGLLGGMGPEASGYMYKKLIEMSVSDFGAKNNDQFPEIILCSVPVPDFISDYKNKQKALNMLKESVLDLNKCHVFQSLDCMQHGSHAVRQP